MILCSLRLVAVGLDFLVLVKMGFSSLNLVSCFLIYGFMIFRIGAFAVMFKKLICLFDMRCICASMAQPSRAAAS